MTTQAIVLPWLRTSPIHIARRDLVLAMADSLTLNVQVVESDNPDALPIEVSGGIGGPLLSLFVWPWSRYPLGWDYGAWWTTSTAPLWSGDFTLTDEPTATFSISFPPGTMAMWPVRACWSMQMSESHGAAVTQLAWGNLHTKPSGQRNLTPTAITTDSGSTINSTVLVA